MKSVYNKYGLLLLVGVLAVSCLQAGNRQEFTKTIKKEFEVARDGMTGLENKYGQIDIKTWDKNRVKIDVQIIVNAGSEKTAQEVFDRIRIEFTNTANYVSAKTQIEPAKQSWWDWRSATKTDYKINYEVYIPPTHQIEVDAKYCNVNVAELQSGGKVIVKYGNLQMAGLGDDATIALNYGKGRIGNTRGLRVEVGYSTIEFKDTKDVDIMSKYSNVTFEEAGDVRSSSKYDTYKLGEIRDFRNSGKYDNFEIRFANNVTITSKYTNFKLGKLATAMDMEIDHGDVKVDEVQKGFSTINLIGQYSDFRIGVAPGADFELDANADYAGIGYPHGMTVTYEKEKSTAHEVKGHQGKAGASVIKARLRYGALKVQQDR